MNLSELHSKIITGKICPYCKGGTILTDSTAIYGRSYGMVYLCQPCGAYVGVHKGTEKALGRLANKELRELKKRAHASFDLIWRTNLLERSSAYKWLAESLQLPVEYTHIGMFSEDTCKRVIELSNQYLLENGK